MGKTKLDQIKKKNSGGERELDGNPVNHNDGTHPQLI
jgi:hypothetical protein